MKVLTKPTIITILSIMKITGFEKPAHQWAALNTAVTTPSLSIFSLNHSLVKIYNEYTCSSTGITS
ncbi:MAG: hypothetical protein LBF87_03355 [Treponema sp.]|nr:hypothetical protein [Treponema sp.]